MNLSHRLRALLAAAVLVACSGCGDPLGRVPISGCVTLDGEPLEAGVILFEPAPGEPAGTAVGAKIHQGRFAIARKRGPVPGVYTVRIYSSSRVQAAPGPGRSGSTSRPLVDRIPERYNRATILRETVAPGTSSTFRFDLHSDMGVRKDGGLGHSAG